MMRLTLGLTIALCVGSASVFAQTTPAPPSPIVVERIQSSFAVTPDYKITELGSDTAHLVGGYGGWLTDNTLLVGGAFYTLANPDDDFGLTYGGLLVGWSMPASSRIQFGVRGLVGVGTATLGRTFDVGRLDTTRFGSRARRDLRAPTSFRAIVDDDFFVFEPELTFGARVTRHISLNVGAGYRLTGYADRLGDEVNGVTGSIGVQFGNW